MKRLSLGFLIVLFVVSLSACSFKGFEKRAVKDDVKDNAQVETADKNIDNVEDKISEEEKEFNESGQAKAIEDETDLWQIFEDDDIGISLRFPLDVGMSVMSESLLLLRVAIKAVEELDDTMGFDRNTALKNTQALNDGLYGENVDWPLVESKKVRELDKRSAQEFMVLSRFEVCNVGFERKLYFFSNDKQVVITLTADRDAMIQDMTKYFKIDEINCAEDFVWDFDKQAEFYKDLENGQGSEFALRWFNAFELIADTIRFTSPEEVTSDEPGPITRLDLLQGKWIAVDDDKTMIEFTANEKISYYADEKLFSGAYNVYEYYNDAGDNEVNENGDYIVVDSEDDVFKYEIMEIGEDVLNLIYLPRGNILKYERQNLF